MKGSKKGSSRSWDAPRITFEQYDENYPSAFSRAAETIRKVLPNAKLEHVGSTSVPGLGGRRVLDIVVIATPKDSEVIHEKLLSIGYKDFPYAYVKPMLCGSVQCNGSEYPLLLYVLPQDHEYVRGWLAFREYMRKHPEEVKQYEQVKKEAISSGKSDPRRYQNAKTPYLEGLVKQMSSSN